MNGLETEILATTQHALISSIKLQHRSPVATPRTAFTNDNSWRIE